MKYYSLGNPLSRNGKYVKQISRSVTKKKFKGICFGFIFVPYENITFNFSVIPLLFSTDSAIFTIPW